MNILGNNSGLQPLFPVLRTSGVDSPYPAIGKPVLNDLDMEVARFFRQGEGAAGVLKNEYGIVVGDVDHKGVVRDRGYITGILEHRPFGSFGSSSGGIGGFGGPAPLRR